MTDSSKSVVKKDPPKYSTEMDQQTARVLFENCAFLIIAGVPRATEFGMDFSSHQIDENFRGMKLIPEGPHYVYCASQSPYGDVGARVGFMHYFKPKEIVIREWDPDKEELRHRRQDLVDVEIGKIRENIKDLDRFLAPYDFEMYEKWKTFTRHITEPQIQALMPSCGLVRTAVEYLSCPDADRPRGGVTTSPRLRTVRSIADEDDLLPDLEPIKGTAPNFTKLPKINTKTANPSDISSSYMDSIGLVENLLAKGEKEILAEIEFSFILYLCGHSTDALAHWRRILALVCNSESAVEKFKHFYKNYLLIIREQLVELPVELMEPTENNSVYKDVKKLVRNCVLGGLVDRADHVTKHLYEKMCWNFNDILDEDPEDLPVVVETD
ncbi:protein AAR2 homolog [Culicoides brevitarsis]|uniref:protein AAR2 homolog n=1 Tax=Culicoides brevitarsis TaxID=469753 RepID=UPI00307C4090